MTVKDLVNTYKDSCTILFRNENWKKYFPELYEGE